MTYRPARLQIDGLIRPDCARCGGDLLDGGLAGQFEPNVTTDGPNRAGPLVLQEGLQEVVGVLRQVLEDGVLEGLASVVGESGVEVGGWGGVVLGGEFFLTSEDQGADVAVVETGDDGLGTVVGRWSLFLAGRTWAVSSSSSGS